jgi:hypothetical protein
VTTPRTLDELRTIQDREERIRAASAYIEHGEEKLREARRIRDADVWDLAAEVGPAEAARRAGVSLSTVKVIRRGPRP